MREMWPGTTPSIDGRRLWHRLMKMAEIGRCGDTGVDRAAFSAEDRAARRLLFEWAQRYQLEVMQDGVANLFLRYPGRKPELAPVLTGSHLDSQPTGGRFDGVFGVLASLEAVAALAESGIRPARSIEVVAWSNEEGSRFAPGMMGSRVFAGSLSIEDLAASRDAAGTTLRTALSETLAALPEVRVENRRSRPIAYLEAHIEQGPLLERAGAPVGVVSGIQGCLWLEYEVIGVSAHAGTTPQDCRQDALEGAMRLVQSMRQHVLEHCSDCRFTVGRVHVEPNTPNTIPGRVLFTIDFRSADSLAFEKLSQELRRTEAPEPLQLQVHELLRHPPETFPPELSRIVAEAARRLGCHPPEITSGAFHDAHSLVNICPVGMIFVRCQGGISHNASEFAQPGDLAMGAQVLTDTLLRLAAAE